MKAKQLIPIMVSDFLFWTATAGLGPIMSRMAQAQLETVESNTVIARMLLTFTFGALAGRALAGAWSGQPKFPICTSVLISALGVVCYFSSSPWFWLGGQGLQGLALGLYAVSMFRLTATLIAPGQRMRGFALIGMADFLGFAFGPVVSGLIFGWYGFKATFVFFLIIAFAAFLASQFLPHWQATEAADVNSESRLKAKDLRKFLPLHVCLMLCLLYHIFYSRFLPIIYDTGAVAIESWFFFGYILGGVAIRLGVIRRLEKLPDRRVFAISILLMSLTAVLVSFFPHIGEGLGFAAAFTGIFYGLGFEALYIFCLTYVAGNAPEKSRGSILAFVFMGFDISNLLAGITFGPLANQLSPQGLFLGLLLLLPVLLFLPLFLRNGKSHQT